MSAALRAVVGPCVPLWLVKGLETTHFTVTTINERHIHVAFSSVDLIKERLRSHPLDRQRTLTTRDISIVSSSSNSIVLYRKKLYTVYLKLYKPPL